MHRNVCTLFLLLATAGLTGCAPSYDSSSLDEHNSIARSPDLDGISVQRVWSQDQLPIPMPAGGFQIHDIDVGTGLSIFIRGEDFTMLFDGGSGDDKAGIDGERNSNRLLSYLFGALGPSGDAGCTPEGDQFEPVDRPRLPIDHLVLSHAHDDHVSLLPDVLRCYSVGDVWEPGAVAETEIYEKFMHAVAAEHGIRYHTAAPPPADRTLVGFKSGTPLTIPYDIEWTQFVDYAADGQTYPLGWEGAASFAILHADGRKYPDANQNSVVVRVDLGAVSMLLVGDAESGERMDPMSAPGDVEKYLMDTYPRLIDVDIHQAGHHGSLSSNRDAFLRMVSPELVLIGAGPKRYGSVILPDAQVIAEYESLVGGPGNDPSLSIDNLAPGQPVPQLLENPRILRTDQSDIYLSDETPERSSYVSTGCLDYGGLPMDRIGNDDNQPGGCDNYVVLIP